jgi:hypothetical protein
VCSRNPAGGPAAATDSARKKEEFRAPIHAEQKQRETNQRALPIMKAAFRRMLALKFKYTKKLKMLQTIVKVRFYSGVLLHTPLHCPATPRKGE